MCQDPTCWGQCQATVPLHSSLPPPSPFLPSSYLSSSPSVLNTAQFPSAGSMGRRGAKQNVGWPPLLHAQGLTRCSFTKGHRWLGCPAWTPPATLFFARRGHSARGHLPRDSVSLGLSVADASCVTVQPHLLLLPPWTLWLGLSRITKSSALS